MLTETLIDILSQHGLAAVDLQTMKGGSHAEVLRHGLDHRRIVKVIRGHEPLTASAAAKLADDIGIYQQLLRSYGVRLPTASSISWHATAGVAIVVLIESDEGKDGDAFLTQADVGETRLLVENLLDTIEPVLQTHEQGNLSVGIDPKPSNFAKNGSGHFSYVDTTPPRFRRNGEVLVDLPVPTHPQAWQLCYWRAFTVEGVLMTLYTQLCRLRPDLRPLFWQSIVQSASRHSAADYFHQLPSVKFEYQIPEQRQAVVADLQPHQMYVTRDLACWFAHRYPLDCSKQWLEKKFQQTHFKGDVSHNFETVRAELIELCSVK